MSKITNYKLQIKNLISKYSLNLILAISAFGTAVSIYFSEYMDLAPCDLCWYQRIFFYPIVMLSFIGIVKKDKNVESYILPFALIGLPISIYHHLLKVTDLFPKDTPFCNVHGACSDIDWELVAGSGITIPFLAMLGFGSVSFILLLKKMFANK